MKKRMIRVLAPLGLMAAVLLLGGCSNVPRKFFSHEACLVSDDGRVAATVFDNAALLRVDGEERLLRSERRDSTFVFYPLDKTGDDAVGKIVDGRYVACGVSGCSKEKEAGLSVPLKKVDRYPDAATLEDYVGLWKAPVQNDRQQMVRVFPDGRVVHGEVYGPNRGLRADCYNATLLTQPRDGLIFGYRNDGPRGKYEGWIHYRVWLDRANDRLILFRGGLSERWTMERVTDPSDAGWTLVRDDLGARLEAMKKCRYAGSWTTSGWVGDNELTLYFDDDGHCMLSRTLDQRFGTWKAQPNGKITIRLAGGHRRRVWYSPWDDKLRAAPGEWSLPGIRTGTYGSEVRRQLRLNAWFKSLEKDRD